MESQDYQLGKLNGRFVVVWWENGRRRRYRLGRGLSHSQARGELMHFIKRRERLVALGANGMTIQDIYQSYMKDREIDGKSNEKQRYSWKALSPYFARLDPSQVDKALCRKFERDRLRAGRAIGTVWTDLSCLRAALNWAHREKIIAVAPFVRLPPQPPPRDRYLTKDEAQRLLDAALTAHIRLFILLALGTAGRAGALLELTWDRVNFERGIIDLRTDETNRYKRRTVVPINATLFAALTEARKWALTDYVIEWAGRRVRTIKRGFGRTAKLAGLAEVTPHTLRHTAAVWMAEAGVPMSEIAQYLGHTSTNVTERVYARYSPDHLRRASAATELPAVRRVRT